VKNIPKNLPLIYVGKPEELVKIFHLLETPIHKVVTESLAIYGGDEWKSL